MCTTSTVFSIFVIADRDRLKVLNIYFFFGVDETERLKRFTKSYYTYNKLYLIKLLNRLNGIWVSQRGS